MRIKPDLWQRLTARLETRCVACLEPHQQQDSLNLCATCLAALPRRLSGYCPRCGEPSADLSSLALCGQCLIADPPWAEFRFYGVFDGALRDLLHRGKYRGDMACLDLLGKLLAQVCSDLPRPDAIVPMPLHYTRLQKRGFNQCREIARPLGRALGSPVRDDLLERVRATTAQTDLNRKARITNLDQAFLGSPKARGLSLLLLDDTATTGTSLRQACTALLRADARCVSVAVLAHATVQA